jgi:propionyl-CoA synthetase
MSVRPFLAVCIGWLVPHHLLSSSICTIGEHSDPDTLNYCKETLAKYGSPVNEAIDHWWQTELGHPAVGNAIGLGRRKMRPGACSGPAPGFDVRIVNDDGVQVPANTLGNMVLKIPMPPGTLPTLYKNDQAYIDSYLTKYPGFYDTGDAAFVDDDGYIRVMGRTDDLIITAGHRLSTGGLEEVLQAHAEVAECAVVKVKDELKGEVPVGFVVLNKGSTMEKEQIKLEVIQSVREQVGPVASFKKVAIVNALPKTRSGKILRGTMSSIANGEPYSITPTIEDAAILTYLEPIIQELVRGD